MRTTHFLTAVPHCGKYAQYCRSYVGVPNLRFRPIEFCPVHVCTTENSATLPLLENNGSTSFLTGRLVQAYLSFSSLRRHEVDNTPLSIETPPILTFSDSVIVVRGFLTSIILASGCRQHHFFSHHRSIIAIPPWR